MSNHLAPSPVKRRLRLAALRHLAFDENGAAYTLSYVMVIPMYLLLICTIIEMSLLLTVKLGTVYAAYAGARSATVWASATEWDKVKSKTKIAAVQAMVPFASGTQDLVQPGLTSGLPSNATDAIANGVAFNLAYKAYANKPISEKYLTQKYAYAFLNTNVEIEQPPSPKSDIKVTVKYKFPFNVPGIGRIIGKKNILTGMYYLDVTSVVSLPNETPQNEDGALGIGYGKF